ncbi:alpha/beta hydrolase [Flavitalea flava]
MTTGKDQQVAGKPSKQVDEVRKYWLESAAAAPNHESLDAARDFGENWQRLTAEPGGVDYIETDAGGVEAMWAVPKGCTADRVILCFHGGGFFSGSMYTHRKLFGHFAKAIGCRALILNYSRSPEHQYPTQVNEALAAYKWLLDQGIGAKHIAFAGDSAGGNLSITTLLLARDKGLPLPAAGMPFGAWLDMEGSGESYVYNAGKDALFTAAWISQMAGMFVGEKGNPKDPYASPVYADLTGLPPVYLQAGGDEMLLDDSTLFAERARKAGIDVSFDIFPGMQHTFHMAAGRAPESNEAIARYAKWVKPKLGLA